MLNNTKKFIFYIILVLAGTYIGYAFNLGFRVNVIESHPAIAVGTVAAIMALAGVFISQYGQYKIAKLNHEKDNEKTKNENLELSRRELYLHLSNLIEKAKNYSSTQSSLFCESHNLTIILQKFTQFENFSDEFKQLDAMFNHAKVAHFELAKIYNITKNDFNQSLYIIHYNSLTNNIINTQEYKNFKSEVDDLKNNLDKISTTHLLMNRKYNSNQYDDFNMQLQSETNCKDPFEYFQTETDKIDFEKLNEAIEALLALL